MSEPERLPLREAKPPYILPKSFSGVRLYYDIDLRGATLDSGMLLSTETTSRHGNNGAQFAFFRLHWKLADASGKTLREGVGRIGCYAAGRDGAALEDISAFAAWYIVLRDVAEQNNRRFHPPSEIPLTLLRSAGERVDTPPHFFTS